MSFSCVLPGLLLSLATSWPAAAPAPNRLMVPGCSLGSICLGESSAGALAPLGKPDFSDAAMQKAWATWYGRQAAEGGVPTELDVYTAPQNNDVDHHTVQVVRATSSFFQLPGGLGTGASLAAIRAAYGKLPLATTYRLPGGTRYLYDDVQKGVAFETDGTTPASRCQAVIVHLPGQAITGAYQSMLIYLKDRPKQQ